MTSCWLAVYYNKGKIALKVAHSFQNENNRGPLYFSMNYRGFSVKSKLIISLFQTVKLSF